MVSERYIEKNCRIKIIEAEISELRLLISFLKNTKLSNKEIVESVEKRIKYKEKLLQKL